MTTEWNATEGRMSGFGNSQKPMDSVRFPHESLGQSCPQHNPQVRETLGEPMAIREVARLIGCSAWTVRHRYLPRGLPHLRSGPSGKLVFFHNQVVRWILQQQKKGGN